MQVFRFSLQRHFLESRNVDITKEDSFSRSGKTFKAVVKNLKATGKAAVKRHPAIPKDDMTMIQHSLDLSSADGLQKKVSLDTMLCFANRGIEKLRKMTSGDCVLHEADRNDSEYLTLRDMHTTNHADDDDDESQAGRKCPLPENPLCPCNQPQRPEFTKEVCRQTLVFVRHMTRFTRFLQTWFVKNKRFGETKGGLSSNLAL